MDIIIYYTINIFISKLPYAPTSLLSMICLSYCNAFLCPEWLEIKLSWHKFDNSHLRILYGPSVRRSVFQLFCDFGHNTYHCSQCLVWCWRMWVDSFIFYEQELPVTPKWQDGTTALATLWVLKLALPPHFICRFGDKHWWALSLNWTVPEFCFQHFLSHEYIRTNQRLWRFQREHSRKRKDIYH